MSTAAPPAKWKDWPVEEKRRLLLKLRERHAGHWKDQARPDQLPPADDWTTLLLTGGRGSGKTWSGAHILVDEIENDPLLATEGPGRWAIVAPTFADARDKCVEGESGLLDALHTTRSEVEAGISPTVKTWNRSIGELMLHDGTMIVIDGADDGAPTIQGENLRGAWADEIGLWKRWKEAWDEALGYAVRKGNARRWATGTPKRDKPARKLIKRMLADPNVVCRRLLTKDNWHNLAATFKENVLRTANTELGRQELAGEMLEEAEGAQWTREWIEMARTVERPEILYDRVLGLDPSDGLDDGDEQGWALMARGRTDDVEKGIYLLDSEGMRTTPMAWLKAAVTLAHRVGAVIVVEKNHGGQFLIGLLEQAMKEVGLKVPYREVTASDGKRTRAEPIAMFYEQGFTRKDPFIRHLGVFEELEDQMCNWTGEPGIPSPDRMDAFVWAAASLTEDFRLPDQEAPVEIEV